MKTSILTPIFLVILFLFSAYIATSQCDCLDDNEPPQIIEFNDNLLLNCTEQFLNFPPIADDNCSEVQTTCSILQTETETNCLLTPTHIALDDLEEAMFIFGLEEVSSSASFILSSGSFSFNEDLTIGHFQGCFTSEDNPDGGYLLDLIIENGMNWEEWSTQDFVAWYRDDLGIAGDNYLDWLYYIASDNSTLIGTGNLEGTSLNLSHAPSSYFYGYQVGLAANNANGEIGSTGWFTFEGIFMQNNQNLGPVDGTVSLFFDHDACIQNSTVVEWTMSDECNNSTSVSQNIQLCGGCTSYGCPGDYNGDGTISAADLLIFINAYFCEFPDDCPEDLTGDGMVNVADLLEFLILMGNDCH